MATSQAASSATAAAVSSGAAGTIGKTIVGSYLFRIDAKDLGVDSIKSSPFSVGGHDWHIKCHDEESAGWVTLDLYLDHPAGPEDTVEAECVFTLMEQYAGRTVKAKRLGLLAFSSTAHEGYGLKFMEREKLKKCLEEDGCVKVRCDVSVAKKKEIPDLAGTHVLTVDGYSNTLGGVGNGEFIQSHRFHVGAHSWYIAFYPRGEEGEGPRGGVTVYLCMDRNLEDNEDVKVRYQLTVLTPSGQKISWDQDFYSFSEKYSKMASVFLKKMDYGSSLLLQNTFHIRFDIVVVKGITAGPMPNPNQHRRIGDAQGSQQIEGDVTFEVGGHLFTAHKYVLTTRSTAFMAEFSGTGKENAADATRVRIDDMEPRVFKALLHFIYTDTLPDEVHGDDSKVVMAQGLLVAADRYAMERLKLICVDMLCNYINDGHTAVTTLRLADEHGCVRLKEACYTFLMDKFRK